MYALEEEQIVLFVGRLVQEKGVHTLLEAAPKILSEQTNVKFVIVGTGPVEAELRDLAHRSGLGHKVHFTGFISDEERNHLFNIADLAVFPSLYEPFGIVALEAIAAGTPVVVSDIGGLADVVEHGRNGLKVYAGDASSLATQVTSLLRNPEWAKALSHTAMEQLKKYDWNRIAFDTLAVYQRVLSEKHVLTGLAETAASSNGSDTLQP
ncbi:glycosyltransferase family 4 protein [Alicyclobacillus tolerans]|nr:glycosyltransferase family 4 protein [Alicyclobacillus tolerans]